MGVGNSYEGIDPVVVNIVKHKARRLVGIAGFVEADREDLEQELVIALLRAMPRFDASRASARTFLNRVANNCAAKLLQRQTAAKRDFRRIVQPTKVARETADTNDITGRSDVDRSSCTEVIGQWAVRAGSEPDLPVDLERAVNRLPASHSSLCSALADQGPTVAAQSIAISRSTAYRWIAQIRDQFRSAGLQAYVHEG